MAVQNLAQGKLATASAALGLMPQNRQRPEWARDAARRVAPVLSPLQGEATLARRTQGGACCRKLALGWILTGHSGRKPACRCCSCARLHSQSLQTGSTRRRFGVNQDVMKNEPPVIQCQSPSRPLHATLALAIPSGMVVWPWLFLWLIGRAFGSQLPDAFKLATGLLLFVSMQLAPPVSLMQGYVALRCREQPRWLAWVAVVFNIGLIGLCLQQLCQDNPVGLGYLSDLHCEGKE